MKSRLALTICTIIIGICSSHLAKAQNIENNTCDEMMVTIALNSANCGKNPCDLPISYSFIIYPFTTQTLFIGACNQVGVIEVTAITNGTGASWRNPNMSCFGANIDLLAMEAIAVLDSIIFLWYLLTATRPYFGFNNPLGI